MASFGLDCPALHPLVPCPGLARLTCSACCCCCCCPLSPSSHVLQDVDLGDEKKEEEQGGLSTVDAQALGEWMKSAMPEKLRDVSTTSRLKSFPAIISDHESGACLPACPLMASAATTDGTAPILTMVAHWSSRCPQARCGR